MGIIFESFKVAFNIQKRYYLNFLFNITSSIFTFVPFIFISLTISKKPVEYILWVVSASGIWIILSQLIWSVGLSIRKEISEGTLEEILLSPSNPILVFIGKSILPVTLSAVSAFLTLLGVVIFSDRSILKLLEVFFLTLPCVPVALGISFMISILVINFKEVFAFLQVLMIFLGICIGLTYPVDGLPRPLYIISRIMLIPEIIRNIREILIYNKSILDKDILINSGVTIITGIIILFVSLLLLNNAIEKMKKKGSYNYV